MHVIGAWIADQPAGFSLFEDISAAAALFTLREILGCLGVPDATQYRCHDLRRGHARDLQSSGRPCYMPRACRRSCFLLLRLGQEPRCGPFYKQGNGAPLRS